MSLLLDEGLEHGVHMRSGAGTARSGSDDAAVISASITAPERFAEVFDRHAPLIFRYLARRVGRQYAEDLTAEVFLTAFRKRHGYDLAYRDARPWLYGIATRLIAQQRRDAARHIRLEAAAATGDGVTSDHAEQVLADVAARATRQRLLAALEQLQARDRDVIWLTACEELAQDEVARALGIPAGTVKSRLNRARGQLRQLLDGSDLETFSQEL